MPARCSSSSPIRSSREAVRARPQWSASAACDVLTGRVDLGDGGDDGGQLGVDRRQPTGLPGAEQQALDLELVDELLQELTQRPQLVGEILRGIHPEDSPERLPPRMEATHEHGKCLGRSTRFKRGC